MSAGGARFERKNRLSGSLEFNRVFRSGRRSVDSQFVVLSTANQLGYPRLGFAVSRKKVRKAVNRNTIKRIVRESFRRHVAELGELDLVIMPQHRLELTDREGLRASLESHWKRVARCKTSSAG